MYSQCVDYPELNCNNNEHCEWVEDIEIIYCNTLPTSGWGPGVCEYYYPDCYNYLDYGGSYGSWSTECGGGTAEIDNSYCQEIEMPECSELDQVNCNDSIYGEGCEWIDDIMVGSCSGLSEQQCSSVSECNWECSQWGSWYTWICYGSYYCSGGNYQTDNSYCEELEYQLGDISQDSIINVQDIIIVVNLILNNEYNYLADMNYDNIVNIIDVLQMVNIVIGND